MTIAFLLIAMGFGYKILVDSRKEKTEGIRFLGLAIGTFIIAVSLGGSICSMMCGGERSYGYGKKMMCPIKK